MNFSTKETLIGLQCLGLDLETGKSTEIITQESFTFSKEDLGL
jgi:hypothetical protein